MWCTLHDCCLCVKLGWLPQCHQMHSAPHCPRCAITMCVVMLCCFWSGAAELACLQAAYYE